MLLWPYARRIRGICLALRMWGRPLCGHDVPVLGPPRVSAVNKGWGREIVFNRTAGAASDALSTSLTPYPDRPTPPSPTSSESSQPVIVQKAPTPHFPIQI